MVRTTHRRPSPSTETHPSTISPLKSVQRNNAQGPSPKARKPSSGQQRTARALQGRPQTRQAISKAEAAQASPTTKMSCSQTTTEQVKAEPSQSASITKKPSLARRLPTAKPTASNKPDDPMPTVSRSTSRHLVKEKSSSSILWHPSSAHKDESPDLAPKHIASQTPVPRISSKKGLAGTVAQVLTFSKNQHPTPGAIAQNNILKSRLPVATPTVSAQTCGTTRAVQGSISATVPTTELSLRRPRALSKTSSTPSNNTVFAKANLRSTTDGSVTIQSLPPIGEPGERKEDLPKTRPPSRTARARKPPSSNESGASVAEPAKAEPEDLAQSNRATQSIDLVLSPVVEEICRRPMTRARSRHLLGAENPFFSETSSGPRAFVRRRASRVMELAQSFEDPTMSSSGTSAGLKPTPTTTEGSPGLLGYTPDRRISASFSSASTASPHSPNLIALAASLSKQHVQRDRQSRARSSITDMLRYSTMSTLGTLRWEDGAGDELLTDENQTEAMVADISTVENTPLRPETEKAALALAAARSKFLSVVSNDEGLKKASFIRPKESYSAHEQHEYQMSSPTANVHPGGRANSYPITPSPLSGANGAVHVHADNSTPTSASRINHTVMAQEAKLAFLSSEIESYQTRERELQRELQQIQTLNQSHIQPSPEREVLLVEEMHRLEAEIHNMTQSNIELENHLDQVNFENEGLREREELMRRDIDSLEAEVARFRELSTTTLASHPSKGAPSDIFQSQIIKAKESEQVFRNETQSEIEVIKSQLAMLSLVKLSLSLQEPLAQELDQQTQSSL